MIRPFFVLGNLYRINIFKVLVDKQSFCQIELINEEAKFRKIQKKTMIMIKLTSFDEKNSILICPIS